jgi:pentatricopeptide repeat protein
MKRFRVAVEEYQYYGVYIEANSAEEAEKMVKDMIDDGECIDYDDEGDGDTRIVEGYTEEINEEGCFVY